MDRRFPTTDFADFTDWNEIIPVRILIRGIRAIRGQSPVWIALLQPPQIQEEQRSLNHGLHRSHGLKSSDPGLNPYQWHPWHPWSKSGPGCPTSTTPDSSKTAFF
jgi:hypothetical protein